MLRTRLVVGSLLAAAAAAILAFDETQSPLYPGLLAIVLLAGGVSTLELVRLMPADRRPHAGACLLGVLAILAANWLGPVTGFAGDPWHPVLFAFAGFVLAVFLLEMATYTGAGNATARIANAVFAAAYLGILASFLARLRWLPEHATLALALTIAVPKGGDIGAYFTGRFLGKHKFSPVLSPKKTWEGFFGGVLAAGGVAVGLSFVAPIFRYGIVEAAAFGVVVGVAGVLGDLAESLIKRDFHAKDAAASVPGFGGLLDVIDSLLFAAPVAYWWFNR
jgi:phosphatidate cytidylyltransferase